MIIKNTTIKSKTWCGQIVEPLEQYKIEPHEIQRWSNSAEVMKDLISGEMVMLNEINQPINFLEAIDLLKGKISQPSDSDGSPIVRLKTTKTGFHYQARSIGWTTSKHGSLINSNHLGIDRGDIVLRFFNKFDKEIISDSEFTQCTRTELNWWPQYDMELLGANIAIHNQPADNALLWVIVAPDIEPTRGGSIALIDGLNLRFIKNHGIDGRSAKHFPFDPINKSNSFRVIIKHEAGMQLDLQLTVEHFKA